MSEPTVPLKLTEDQMAYMLPTVTPKTELAVIGDATYVKHRGEWWLLDADKHGHPSVHDAE
jgi:hypothetical protein